jgi:hypothetical protein
LIHLPLGLNRKIDSRGDNLLFTGRSFVTDSLVHPTWKTTHHTHKNKYKNNERYMENFKKKMMEYCNLELVSESLKYDIHNVTFPFNG